MNAMRMMCVSVLVGLSICFCAKAEIAVNPLFTDGAVFQREVNVPVWGTGTDGEKVVVSFSGQTAEATVANGKWDVRLKPMPANAEGQTLLIKGSNTIEIKDVLVGEVWLCSGQSNMEFKVIESVGGKEAIAEGVKEKGAMIRLFHVPRGATLEPQSSVKAKWNKCEEAELSTFAAVGYFFGREIKQKLNIPVGLIESSVGGTRAERWTSKKALAAEAEFARLVDDAALARHAEAVKKFDPAKAEADYKIAMEKHKAAVEKAKAEGKKAPVEPKKATEPVFQPTTLYNAMIAPLQPYAMRGVLWYQGESNRPEPRQYPKLLATMVKDWRADWGLGDFPFLFVQVAGWSGMTPEIREAQLKSWKIIPNSAMAVTTDVGDAKDIHPTKKEPVGHRLALAARALVYGEKIEYSGPVYESSSINGNVVSIRFTHIGGGLKAGDAELKGFTIAGEDKKFVKANAKIVGETVEVSSPEVASPVAARYGWANVPDVNLFNAEGLPASPFRTDE